MTHSLSFIVALLVLCAAAVAKPYGEEKYNHFVNEEFQPEHNKKKNMISQELEDEIQVDSQGGMQVLFAYYGLSCSNGHITHQNRYQSTKWVSRLCNGKNYCSGTVSVHALSDPYYGCGKDFLAIAKCSNGQTIAQLVPKEANGRRFSLACY